jgi:replicative DNA helicase
VIEVLRPSDFYTEAHSRDVRDDAGCPTGARRSTITLNEELRRTGSSTSSAAPPRSRSSFEQASIAAHLHSYAQIVRDMAVLRELIQTSTQIITQAFDAKEDVQTLVDDAERKIFGLAERRLEGSALPVGKILKNTFEHIERLYERKEHVTGVATGFEKLDLRSPRTSSSCRRPSMGRSSCLTPGSRRRGVEADGSLQNGRRAACGRLRRW